MTPSVSRNLYGASVVLGMSRILILLASLLVVGNVYALPPCPPDVFHNCSGTQTSANGSQYVGEYKDGKFHGQGTLTAANGHEYIGEFKDGKLHGEGTLTLANGTKYVGEFRNGKAHGQGTQTLATGTKYVGEWKYGKFHGEGITTFADGRKYVGEFKDGKAHGAGTFTWADGREYVGESKNGDPWIGIMYSKDGSVFSQYHDGVEVAKQSYGSSTNKNVMDDTNKK